MYFALVQHGPDGSVMLAKLRVDHAMAFHDLIVEAIEDAWIPVPLPPSTNIATARYCRAVATVRVTFKNGGVYDYFAVHPDIVDEWSESDSPGVFLNQVLKNDAVYPCRKVESV